MSDSVLRQPISLRQRVLLRLWGVVALLVSGFVLSLWLTQQAAYRNQHALLELQADKLRASLVQRLDYYRGVSTALARDPEMHDLMRFGSREAQQEWALARQRLLPDTLGVALIDVHGEVLGHAETLRVGPQCQADLKRPNARMNGILVHRDLPGTEHIDLVAAVRDPGGEVLGSVFLSLRLQQLQRIVDESVYPGFTVGVTDADGVPIAGNAPNTAAAQIVRLPIGHTGWTLTAAAPPPRLTWGNAGQIAVALATLAAVLLVMIECILRLHRNMTRDLVLIRDGLGAVARGEDAPVLVPHYREFAEVMGDIDLIARELNSQRERLAQLSLTDALTSLPNRRAFESRFGQMQGLASRGHAVALVLLDVDHFKAVNDRLGHGTGDRVLTALAATLKALTRSTDMSARLAGDEFAVLLTGLDNPGVSAWYLRLSDRFKSELRAAGLTVDTSVSAGHTWLNASDTLGRALSRADRALYRAKEGGRGQLAFSVEANAQGAG